MNGNKVCKHTGRIETVRHFQCWYIFLSEGGKYI